MITGTVKSTREPTAEPTPENDPAEHKERRLKKTIRATAIGAVAGFAGAYGFLSLADTGAIGDLDPSQTVAGLIALIYLLMTAAIGIGLIAPKAGASYLNIEDADEMREQRGQLAGSCVGTGAAGLALLVAALGGPGGPIDATTALVLFVGLIVVATVVSLRMVKRQDELMRAVSRESAAIAYYLVGLVGSGWALLAHLEFASAPAPLDWLSMFWGLMLLAAFIGVGKRGMLAMR